jgi:endonuclease G
MMKRIFSLLILILPFVIYAQTIEDKLNDVEKQLSDLEQQRFALLGEKEELKLRFLRRELMANGLPLLKTEEELIVHEAMSLVYSEEHEQAKWVAHIILPDVMTGNASRSNDFREDPLVKTGTAVEKDYFLTLPQADGSVKYDGFGFDRGHLAPSADFRWSKKALSESYFYSNMSPQRAEFNREGWGELEAMMRGYIYNNPTSMLYVVTGPVLNEGLPVIERGINKPSIPEYFFKVAMDLDKKRAIGFVMPNERLTYPPESFVKPISEIEEMTGIDFFHNLPDDLEKELEAMTDYAPWMSQSAAGDIAPLRPTSLPPGHFNTVQAQRHKGSDKVVSVCGTVVHTKFSKKGNAMLYLDKGITDPLFIIFIRKDKLINFGYDPVKYLKGQTVCVKGKVGKIGETPTMFLDGETQLWNYEKD